MKILTLKEVLKNEVIKKELKTNLFENFEDTEKEINKVLNSSKFNSISIETMLENKNVSFENTLHVDKEKNIYLLESRLFSNNPDSLLKSYLGVFNSNMEIIREYIDDVWEYGNWNLV